MEWIKDRTRCRLGVLGVVAVLLALLPSAASATPFNETLTCGGPNADNVISCTAQDLTDGIKWVRIYAAGPIDQLDKKEATIQWKCRKTPLDFTLEPDGTGSKHNHWIKISDCQKHGRAKVWFFVDIPAATGMVQVRGPFAGPTLPRER